ncbi:MAG: ECF transporter S component [Chloroflexota bacterium]
MTETTIKKGWLAQWSTRDLMVTVVMALAVAIASIPLRLGTSALGLTLGPIVSVPLSSYVILGGFFVAYVVRRPMAAAISQLIVGLVLSVMMPGGLFLIILYLIHAIAIELPFVVTRYKRYDNWIMAIGGAVARFLILAAAWTAARLGDTNLLYQLGVVAGALLGGAIAGLLAKLLAEAVAQTGILSISGDESVETAV